MADRLQLVQSHWHSGDYRTAGFEVEVSEDGKSFRQAGRSLLANQPGAKADVMLTAGKMRVLRVTILGSHD